MHIPLTRKTRVNVIRTPLVGAAEDLVDKLN